MSQEKENYVPPIFPLDGGEEESLSDSETASLEEFTPENEEVGNVLEEDTQVGGATISNFHNSLKKQVSALVGIFDTGYSELMNSYLPPYTDLYLDQDNMALSASVKTFDEFKTLFPKKSFQTYPVYFLYRILSSAWDNYKKSATIIGKLRNKTTTFAELKENATKENTERESKVKEAIAAKQDPKTVPYGPNTYAVQNLLLSEIGTRLYILIYLNIFSKDKHCGKQKVGTKLFEKYTKFPDKAYTFRELVDDLEGSFIPMGKCLFDQTEDVTAAINLECLYEILYEYGIVWSLENQIFTKFSFFTSMADFFVKVKEIADGIVPSEEGTKTNAKAEWTPAQLETVANFLHTQRGEENIARFTIFDNEVEDFLKKPDVISASITREIFDKILNHINTDVGVVLFKVEKLSEKPRVEKSKLKEVETPSDGWCFYHSLLRQVGAADEYAKKSNEEIDKPYTPVDAEVKTFIEKIQAWIKDPVRKDKRDTWDKFYLTDPTHKAGDYEGYINTLASESPKKWADPEYGIGLAAATILNAKIEIYIIDPKNPTKYIQYYEYNTTPPSSKVLKILYINRNHYKVLLDVEGAEAEAGPKIDCAKLKTAIDRDIVDAEKRKALSDEDIAKIKKEDDSSYTKDELVECFKDTVTFKPEEYGFEKAKEGPSAELLAGLEQARKKIKEDTTTALAKVREDLGKLSGGVPEPLAAELTALGDRVNTIKVTAANVGAVKLGVATQESIDIATDVAEFVGKAAGKITTEMPSEGEAVVIVAALGEIKDALTTLVGTTKTQVEKLPAELRGGARKNRSKRKTRKHTHKNRKV